MMHNNFTYSDFASIFTVYTECTTLNSKKHKDRKQVAGLKIMNDTFSSQFIIINFLFLLILLYISLSLSPPPPHLSLSLLSLFHSLILSLSFFHHQFLCFTGWFTFLLYANYVNWKTEKHEECQGFSQFQYLLHIIIPFLILINMPTPHGS